MAADVGERPARSSRAAMTWTELPRGRSGSKCPPAPPISPDAVLPGWLEVEGESDVWSPHVSEWREREATGVFWSIRKMCTRIRPDNGPRHPEDVENGKYQVEEEL